MATKKQREVYKNLCKKFKKPHPLTEKLKDFNPNKFIGEFNPRFHE